MITFLFRWSVPLEQRAEFTQNWEDLTREVQLRYGMYAATLYVSGEEFVSITQWPTQEAWERWRHELADHPYRNKWRTYRILDPEVLVTLVQVGVMSREPDS